MRYSPYIHTEKTLRSTLIDVFIALTPAAAWGIFIYGARAATIIILTVVSAVIFDISSGYAMIKFTPRKPLDTDSVMSSALSGLLVAFMLPVTVPLWLPPIGAFIAVVIAKRLFGGLGRNIFNPAFLSAAVLNIAFSEQMSRFIKPFSYFNAFMINLDSAKVDAYRVASPLQMLKAGSIYEDGATDLFYGTAPGNIGEAAALLLFLGAGYLIVRKVIDYKASGIFFAVVFFGAFVFPQSDSEAIYFALFETLAGGAVLAAVFACNDFTTTPKRPNGKLIFAAGCGFLALLLRYLTNHAEGVYIAVLIMNILSVFIDKVTKQTPYGMIIKKNK